MNTHRISLLTLLGLSLLSASVPGQGADIPYAIAVDSSGNVYVAGTSMNRNGRMDIIALAWDKSGNPLNSVRIPGEAAGGALCAGIRIQGSSVIVSGTNPGAQSGYDMILTSIPRSVLLLDAERPANVADLFTLEQGYPNPVLAGRITLPFTLSRSGHALFALIDIAGNEICRILDEELPAGRHEPVFDTAMLPPGTYIAVLSTTAGMKIARFTILR
jgi:hypothetical protein